MSFTPPLRKCWNGHKLVVVHDDDEAEEMMIESNRVQRWYATYNAALTAVYVKFGDKLNELQLHEGARDAATVAHGPLEKPKP